MKTINNFILLLAIIFISNVFGITTNCISTAITNNYNNTGTIFYQEYESSLNIEPDTIKVYNYIDSTLNDLPEINLDNLEANTELQDLEPNLISVLIPRKIKYIKKTNSSVEDDILSKMYTFIDTQNNNLNSHPTTESCLNAIESYLVTNKLESSLSLQKKEKFANAIIGSHALLFPQNKSKIKCFNGYGRLLSTPVTHINDLLLTKNDLGAFEGIAMEKQISNLQHLIFKETKKAKTVIFIPECISSKLSNNQTVKNIRLPIAIIHKIDLNLLDNIISIQFLVHKMAENGLSGCGEFLEARKLFFQNELNTDDQWEFINYTFKIDSNYTSKFNNCYKDSSEYYYNISSINIEQNGIVNIQQNHNAAVINDTHDSKDQQEHNTTVNDPLSKKIPPCEHYNRKCLVKFKNENIFVPCHRCYNIEKKVEKNNYTIRKKALDITELKCLVCGYEQIFAAETGHNCLNCGIKFAEYYCGICKHLTDKSKYPYHCDKCGICRVDGDKVFHCDVCGVCLDVQLKNNHKCRAGSAHDGCCVCKVDAFIGCQILPCGHKIHKECATIVIKMGATKCPICEKSFAHKIANRSSDIQKKRKKNTT
jgi:RING finger/CHY zinc finger protein 1